MIHALVQRWNGFQPVRDLYKNPPTPGDDGDDCPICLDQLLHRIIGLTKLHHGRENVLQRCVNIGFAQNVGYHYEKNHFQYSRDSDVMWFDSRDVRKHVCCPMCRHEIEVV